MLQWQWNQFTSENTMALLYSRLRKPKDDNKGPHKGIEKQ